MKRLSKILIVQITDTHLFANEQQKLSGIKTAKSFEMILRNIEKLEHLPDFLILTGDLQPIEELRGTIAAFGKPV